MLSMDVPDPQKTHFVWSVSKDLALNGLRLGVFVSQNPMVVKAMRYFSTFSNISTLTDYSIRTLLKDKEWMDQFILENQKRLRSNYECMVSYLKSKGLEYVPASAGFFVWIKIKGISTLEEEIKKWHEWMDLGVLILPSHGFHSQEYGWFRILFTLPWSLVQKGLDRAFSNWQD